MSAIQLMGFAPDEQATSVLDELLTAREPKQVQLTAVRALSTQRRAEVGQLLVKHWRSFSPPIRREVAEALFSRANRLPALLDALEQEQVPVRQLDPIRREALLKHRDPSIRRRSEKLLGQQRTGDLQRVIGRYRAALKLQGNGDRGAKVFEQSCATCHRAGGKGFSVGPDLATMQHRSSQELLEHILDPNREVQPNYVNYQLISSDGRDITGIIVQETATSVTLRRAEDAEDRILRSNINELFSMGLSIMPEGLEQDINLQQMADLIRFIQTSKETSVRD
ncbi:c-type cytochrome [Acidobacteria bacterium AH-259-G07]|nr:c-type cytochrome [Acidobacteria bacterium AH-259-G07]